MTFARNKRFDYLTLTELLAAGANRSRAPPWLAGLCRWLPGLCCRCFRPGRARRKGPGFAETEEAPHPGPAAFLPRGSMPGRPGVR